MSRKSKLTGRAVHSVIESLESRLLLANIHITDAYLVDEFGNSPLLPGSKPASAVVFRGLRSAHQLMRKHAGQRFHITEVATVLDLCLQLGGRIPQIAIEEEQSRGKL